MAELSPTEVQQVAVHLETLRRETIGMSLYLNVLKNTLPEKAPLKNTLPEKAPLKDLLSWYSGRVNSVGTLLTVINELHILLQIPHPILPEDEDALLDLIALHDADSE